MDWAFRTNIPVPNITRTFLLPLVFSSPIYSLRDILALFDGFQFSTVQMFEEIKAYTALRWGTRFEVPFFFFQGESEVITLTPLAKEYFSDVDAPIKKFVLIKDAGHFAAFTQPEQFLNKLRTHVHPLAVEWNREQMLSE